MLIWILISFIIDAREYLICFITSLSNNNKVDWNARIEIRIADKHTVSLSAFHNNVVYWKMHHMHLLPLSERYRCAEKFKIWSIMRFSLSLFPRQSYKLLIFESNENSNY